LSRGTLSTVALVSLAAALIVAGAPERAEAEGEGARGAGGEVSACNDQRPLPFLVRGNYAYKDRAPAAERSARARMHREAIRYRTERYGRVKGFSEPGWNPSPAVLSAEHTSFMGISVDLHRKVVPAVRCVEREIRSTCPGSYRPDYLSGFRSQNSFNDGEVSNHLYGIALDVDPEHNVCCRCLGPAATHPACARPGATIADRMRMPACWIGAFERFGFYWLGRDELEDTMHFEFLGDPDRIARAAP
jgi:hypothetical protein